MTLRGDIKALQEIFPSIWERSKWTVAKMEPEEIHHLAGIAKNIRMEIEEA